MMQTRQLAYLSRMGITVWRDRSIVPSTVPTAVSTVAAQAMTTRSSDWDDLATKVSSCQRCALAETRTQTVFGVGNDQADWLIIGEAPGAEEDKQGEPFVGRAGKLLDAMLLAIGLNRESVYIANILKCRPPKNRDPKPEEVAQCEPYLVQQINFIKPKIIIAVGRVAAQNLLKVSTPIGKMRGQCYQYPSLNIPVVVTYHPAYLLRSPSEKYKVWQDLKYAMSIYKGLV